MVTRHAATDIIARASSTLAQPLELVEVVRDEPGYRHRLFRCRSASETVIVKSPVDDAWRSPEAAALKLVAAKAPGLAPQLLAVDEDSGLLVLEDLGCGPRLAELLTTPGAIESAVQGLKDWVAAIATLHASCWGASVPKSLRQVPEAATHSVYQIDDALQQLEDALESDVHAEMLDVRARLQTRDWHHLTHGDAAVSNAMRDPEGRLRLYDFEVAGVRSIALDAAVLTGRLLATAHAARLPPGVASELHTTYFRVLLQRVSTDADGLRAAIDAAGVAWRAVELRKLAKARKRERPAGPGTRRQRILEACNYPPMIRQRWPGLTRALGSLAKSCRRDWGDLPRLPLYEAFRSETVSR